ncbi:MAG: DUF2313 domain-containing protein [Fibrobacter sp.]|nr:DUF2313 domain-containing protein [Fibrobacter sp.]MBQ3778153.1 DUF2313 domain-containing protein [Fibrobacter sp.]
MAVNPFESRHYSALTQLYPLQMDAEEYAVAKEFDRALESADAVYREIFPGSAITTLERWENLYKLGHSGSLEARRQALLEAINRESGIAERHYKALAAAIGYTIDITKPPRIFRAGVSRAGFEVYDPDEQYIWTVTCNRPESECSLLVRTLEAHKIPFTFIRWNLIPDNGRVILESGGFLLLESGGYLLLENDNQILVEN